MGKFSDYVLCSDMDYTLLDDNHNISQKNIDAINYFKSQGGRFTIATGRIMKSIEYYLQYISVDLPMVVMSGAGIYDSNNSREVWNCKVGDNIYLLMEYVVEKFPAISIELLLENSIVVLNDTDFERQHMMDLKTEYSEIFKVDRTIKPHKICFCSCSDEINKLIADIKNTEYYNEFQCISSDAIIYEILNKNANKGSALANLCRLYDIDKNKLITVGDNENDIEMLKFSKYSFAPENAIDATKSVANYVGPSNNNSVISYVVEKMDQIIK